MTTPAWDWLLLTSFDRTLVDFDVCERLVEQLAPELLAMLVGQDSASMVGLTNTVLAELQRRGVSRDALIEALQALGCDELTPAACDMLRLAKERHRAAVRVVSPGANGVFVHHVLAGRKAAALVDGVVANAASFERVGDGADAATPAVQQLGGKKSAAPPAGKPQGVGQKLVVKATGGGCDRGCPMCPGREVRAAKQQGRYRSIVFCGAGAADVCAARALGPGDCVLARGGHALAEYAACAAAGKAEPLAAKVVVWRSPEEMRDAVLGLMEAGVK